MSVLEDVLEDSVVPLLIGAGVLLAAPILFPALGGGLRPVAKRAVRGYLSLREKAKEMTAEAREQLSDLVAEAKAEAQAETASGEAATPAPPEPATPPAPAPAG